MKTFREFNAQLPKNTLVTAYCKFDPPSTKHDLLIQFIQKVADIYNGEFAIFITENGIIPIKRRLHYLSLLYPKGRFIVTSALTLAQAIDELNNKYYNIIAISDTLKTEDVKYKFNYIKIINVSPYLDFDQYSDELVTAATTGDWKKFKTNIPNHMRFIDAQRMMNDIRVALNLSEIKIEPNSSGDNIREQYIQGQIYKLGDTLNIDNQDMKIIKRGTNYVILENSFNQTFSRFIHDL